MGKFQRIADVLKRQQLDKAEQAQLETEHIKAVQAELETKHINLQLKLRNAPGDIVRDSTGNPIGVKLNADQLAVQSAAKKARWKDKALTELVSMRDAEEKYRDLADKLEKGAIGAETLSKAIKDVFVEPEPALWFNAATCCVVSGEPAKFAYVVGHRGMRSITVCGKPSDWEVPHDVRAIEVPEELQPAINSVLVNICKRHAAEFYRERLTYTRIGDKFFRLEFVDG